MKGIRRNTKLHLTDKKTYFDKETLTNPFSDTRVLFGDAKTQVKRLLAGIDSDTAELLLADRLTEKGTKIDLVVSHHPGGHALASLYQVMDVHIDMFSQAGVPENVAHSLFTERKEYIRRRFGPLNHTQNVDAARLLEIPFMSIHILFGIISGTHIWIITSKRRI